MAKKLRSERALFLFGILIILAVFGYMNFLNPESGVAATVNGEEITKIYVETRYNLLSDNVKNVLTLDDFVDQTIDSFLLAQEAANQGYSVSDEELTQRVDIVRENLGLTADEFRDQIEQEGVTVQEFREDLRRNIILGNFLNDNVISQILVTEEEITRYLEDVNLAEIGLSEEEARLQAEQLLIAQKAEPTIQLLLDQIKTRSKIIKN